MLGAIIGDISGSRFEHYNIKSKGFTLFSDLCRPTDDTAMTLAVAKAILACDGDYSDLPTQAIRSMQEFGQRYPYAGYGSTFRRWLYADDPQPYGSWGNGAAMRVSACGFAATSLEEAKQLSRAVTAVTHDHPEGLKGAEATAVAIYFARTGCSLPELREFICQNYYDLNFTLDGIRESYGFDVSCQGSVPQALEAFFESVDFEDAIRGAISIGGDSDTIAAITGGIAEAYYGIPASFREPALQYLDAFQLEILTAFEKRFGTAAAR